MCHVFDSTLRLYVQTARARTGWRLAAPSGSRCSAATLPPPPLPSVCLSVTDAGGRTADGWLINAGPLQFRAAADG